MEDKKKTEVDPLDASLKELNQDLENVIKKHAELFNYIQRIRRQNTKSANTDKRDDHVLDSESESESEESD